MFKHVTRDWSKCASCGADIVCPECLQDQGRPMEQNLLVTEQLAQMFEQDNLRFDREKWFDASRHLDSGGENDVG